MTTTSPPAGGGATRAPATEVTLWVPGKPRGKDRPRFDGRTGRTFTTAATTNAEASIVAVWRDAGEPRLPDGAAKLVLFISVERPAGHFKKDGHLSAAGQRQPFPASKKPDVDNCLKLVMDALNGRAYKDDVQIVAATIARVWSDRPGLHVQLVSWAPVEGER